MAAAAVPLAIVSSVMAGGASIASGFSQRNAMKSEAKAAELDAKYARLRATQVGAQREEETNTVIAQINAIRVGRGAGLDSATGRALRANARKRGGEVKRQDVSNEIVARDSSLFKAKSLRAAGSVAPILGVIKGFGHFADAAGTAFPGKVK